MKIMTWEQAAVKKAELESNIGRLFRFYQPDDVSMITAVTFDGEYLSYLYMVLSSGDIYVGNVKGFDTVEWLTPQR